MRLQDAANICRPLDRNTFGPQDRTLDRAEHEIGQQNLLIAEDEAKANVDATFRSASYVLETEAINLRAFSRGMIAKETLPAHIKRAREALDAMEAAVTL